MKKLVLLLIVLAVCVPSYGIILVYDVSTKVTGAFSKDGTADSWVIGQGTAKAYFIVDADFSGTVNNAKFIPYGTNQDKQKVFVTNSVITSTITIRTAEKTPHNVWQVDIAGITNALAEVNDVNVTAARMVGITTTMKAGSLVLGEAAQSLSGSVIADSSGEAAGDAEFFAAGTVQSKMDNNFTKNAFINNWNFTTTVTNVEASLTKKKFTGVAQ